MPVPRSAFHRRWSRIARFLRSNGGDAYVASLPNNMRYLHYTGSPHSPLATQVVVFPDAHAAGTTSCLEMNRMRDLSALEEVAVFGRIPGIPTDAPDCWKALAKVLKARKTRRIWSDSPLAVSLDGRKVRAKVKDIVCGLRLRKDEHEIRLLRTAARIGDAASNRLDDIVRPGRAELDISHRIDTALLEAGASTPSFPTIVAAGAHAAYPHHDNTASKVRAGETVVCDFGALHEGYNSDLTRTRRAGGGSSKAKVLDIFAAVQEAHRAQVRCVKTGVSLRKVDLVGRAVIDDYGFGPYFCHSTGHGIGLEVHERPRVSPLSPDRAQPGMVFTIEPGVYVPGVGGARIEDDLWMGPDGPVLITRSPRGL